MDKVGARGGVLESRVAGRSEVSTSMRELESMCSVDGWGMSSFERTDNEWRRIENWDPAHLELRFLLSVSADCR